MPVRTGNLPWRIRRFLICLQRIHAQYPVEIWTRNSVNLYPYKSISCFRTNELKDNRGDRLAVDLRLASQNSIGLVKGNTVGVQILIEP